MEFKSITIKELIEYLNTLPQDAKIGTINYDGWGENYASSWIEISDKDGLCYRIGDDEEMDYYIG